MKWLVIIGIIFLGDTVQHKQTFDELNVDKSSKKTIHSIQRNLNSIDLKLDSILTAIDTTKT